MSEKRGGESPCRSVVGGVGEGEWAIGFPIPTSQRYPGADFRVHLVVVGTRHERCGVRRIGGRWSGHYLPRYVSR